MDGLIVDSFAGGGGASVGIERALGRSPDIAINHDEDALAMHAVNHPSTLHLSKNIWKVDPRDHVRNRRVALAWFSPDCKHFSKAKGGKPVKKNIRDLAWVVVLWARTVRPAVIILENVEEFQDWGPVSMDGAPCKARKGQEFKRWKTELMRLGYKVEWAQLRACDYGAPTIRKRLFLVARCDGERIVWPEPTHGAPDSEEVKAGRRKPWRTAADIIDWSLPCPSIFDTAAEIKAKYGLKAKRPLAEATKRRIARGVVRYVLEAKRPFIVPLTHQGGFRGNSVDEPLRTQTTANRGEHALVAPLITGCGGRAGQSPPRSVDAPMATLTAKPDHVLASAFLARFTQNGVGQGADEPLDTVMAGAPKFGLVAAFMAQHNTGVVGHRAEAPVSTMTQRGTQQQVVAAHLMNLRGSDRRDAYADEPLRTVSAGGNHAAIIAAFLTQYYGNGEGWSLERPTPTDTTRDRCNLVTVDIDGETYAIADIGMRMLTPRERFRAQGFPESYIIDRRPDGSALTLTAQGRMCGNSVCPDVAEALVRANVGAAARPESEAA